MTDILSLFAWWLIVTVFGLAAWPILFRLLRFLPDRGYSLAKTGGLLAVGYCGWLLGNFGFVSVNAGGVLAALLIVVGLAVVSIRGQADAMGRWLNSNGLVVVGVEAVFLLAFGAWAYARALNPTITATEKPMEFGFLNSVLRTGLQPPGDPWLSGYAISYYYFGYVIMGMLTAMSGVQPSVAFNLGIALLFALTATGAFGVLLNLVAVAGESAAAQSGSAADGDPSRPQSWLRAAIVPALLGPVFVLMGNFNGPLEIAHKAGLFAATPDQAAALAACPVDNRYCLICQQPASAACGSAGYSSSFWGWLDIKWTNNPPGVPVANEGASAGIRPDRFLWWWQSSRVVHDRNLFGDEVEVIDEFPFFSFLLGDMHPHVLGLPFVFLAVAFSLNLFVAVMAGAEKKIAPQGSGSPWERVRSWLPLEWPDLFGGAVILGGLSFLNTWDFPIYTFVVVAAYIAGRASREGWRQAILRDGALLGLTLAVLGVLLYLPFYVGFRSQLGGLMPNVVFGTRIQQFLVMFGPVLAVLVCLLGWYAVRHRGQLDWRFGLTLGGVILLGLIVVCIGLALAIVGVSGGRPDAQSAIDGMIGQTPLQEAFGLIMRRRLEFERLLTPVVLAIVLAVAGAGVSGLARSAGAPGAKPETESAGNRSLVPFLFVLIITGALLTLGPEFIYLRDLFGTRMNTVFKFYYQAWVVWALASAFGAWWLWREIQLSGRVVFGAAVGAVIALGLVYPILATATITDNWQGTTRDDQNQPFATLDGTAYMQRSNDADYEAIQFLNSRVKGRPVIAEAVGGSYTQFARISAHTGLPTILGWPFHELQWRGTGDLFAGREDDVRKVYTSNSWDETLLILDKYRVRYVYVGPLEQGQYGQLALEKFERNLSRIYDNNGVVIFEYKGG